MGSLLVTPSSQVAPVSQPLADSTFERRLFLTLSGAVLIYALLAGLRTVADYDLGWQMATGRWVVQHKAVSSVDVFSYTAAGQDWIYPVGSGLLFYATFLLGGYGLLSWLGAVACAASTALLLRRGTAITAGICVFAIPRIAARTAPRADLFTVVLFAAFLSLLWEQYETGRARCWLLPLLMATWVNLHLGFISGLALTIAYIGLEVLRGLTGGAGRSQSLNHLRKAWPWLVATWLATFLNPWGWNIYRALLRQQQAMVVHAQWITEWASQPLSWEAVLSKFSTLLALLAVAGLAAVLSTIRRQWGPAILLLAATYIALRHVRMQALFACVVVVVGSTALRPSLEMMKRRIPDAKMRAILASGAAAALVVASAFFSADVVSNRHYLGTTNNSNFGTGMSWWFPERAAVFIERNQIPGQIFNVYNEGGYFAWRLGPGYLDYIDGRAIPFGTDLFVRSEYLVLSNPDSEDWRREADRYGIRALLVPLGRYEGLSLFPRLRQFCSSQSWRPVYLDEVSAVFLRNVPANQALIERLGIDCATVPLPATVSSNRAEAFNQWSNAAGVLYVVGRRQEALAASNRALAIFPGTAIVHFIRAKCYADAGMFRPAELDYLAAAELEPNDVVLTELAQLYAMNGQTELALQTLERATRFATQPYRNLLTLGEAYLEAQRPRDAVRFLDEAEQKAPRELTPTEQNKAFLVHLAQGRAIAWSGLGDPRRAIRYQEDAARLSPNDPGVWRELAKLYAAVGRSEDASRAGERAKRELLGQTATSEAAR